MRIYNKRALFALGNMNLDILEKIKSALKRFGIPTPKITSSPHQKYVGKDGYGHNGPYYTLSLHKKSELPKLLKKLAQFSRHPNKIKDIKLAIENIVERNQATEKGAIRVEKIFCKYGNRLPKRASSRRPPL
ncbi:hypothetical protein KKE06_00330 [Candidatus Micrarchaeota archaeon]|nr:hypothetical protein [Candidatus Micrarchaeota archaeon]MBU1930492.1 hypothetical protein [Candidatus Micrarchaeota archaeon]